jgi:hypothetical protein
MKPDWSTAPDFARYLAMDEDGEWFWFENKPEARNRVWMVIPHFAHASVGKGSVSNWRDTLEERPVHNEHEAEGK